MKIRYVVLGLALLWAGWGAAQSLSTQGLPSLQQVIEGEELQSVWWSLAYRSLNSDIPRLHPDAVADRLRAQQVAATETAEQPFIEAFAHQIAAVVEALDYVDGTTTEFLADESSYARFFMHQGQPGVAVSGMGLPLSFNTFNTDFLHRVRTVVFDKLIPELPILAEQFEPYGFGYAGVSVSYAMRDFTDDAPLTVYETETVVLLVPMRALRMFANLELSDADLAAQAEVYAGSAGLRRVDVYR